MRFSRDHRKDNERQVLIMRKYEDMEDYLASDAIGSSQLKQIMRTPRDYKFSLKAKKKETSAQAKGTLYHSYMLERDLYKAEHMIQPEDWGSLSENPGRKKWAEFKAKAKLAGKTPVKFKDAQDLLLLDDVIESHAVVKEILATHKAEVSFYGEIDGIKLKSREDLWSEADGTVWDVKTTSKDLDDKSLAKVIFDCGYHFSAAHHIKVMSLCGYDVKSWGWIFVSTASSCPHIVVKKASRELLEYGETDFEYALQLLKECSESGAWPGYSEQITEIGLPSWAERRYYNV